jgi:hypothetical protein
MKDIPIRLKQQEKSQWCYAAAIQATAAHYGTSLTQKSIAQSYIQPRQDDNCPQDPVESMNRIGIFNGYHPYNGRGDISEITGTAKAILKGIVDSINGNHPVLAMIGGAGQNHYILIKGYDVGDMGVVLHILDPVDGAQHNVPAIEFFGRGFNSKYIDQSGMEHEGYSLLRGVVYSKSMNDPLLPPKGAKTLGGKRRRTRSKKSQQRRTSKRIG